MLDAEFSFSTSSGLSSRASTNKHGKPRMNLPDFPTITTDITIQTIIDYGFYLKKQGRAPLTIDTQTKRLARLLHDCDLSNPESVKEFLANTNWKNSTKNLHANIYTGFLHYLGTDWNKPKYTNENRLPFIPTEEELDTLIHCSGIKTAVLLQTLKETGARISELAKLKWTDIDLERRTIHITACKGSNSRILPLSPTLVTMLNKLPRKQDHVFGTNTHGIRKTFQSMRKRTVNKFSNPRLKQIHFHTFRHWKGTTEYHETKDIMHVKKILGHKSIANTMVYINLESALWLSNTDEFTCKVATTTTEATKLIENGFEHVTNTPNNEMLFRKRK